MSVGDVNTEHGHKSPPTPPAKLSNKDLAEKLYLDEYSEVLFADGFEEACIGLVHIFNLSVVVYDRRKCIDILMRRDGMSEEGAEEFFEYNVQGAYMGKGTPAFFTPIEKQNAPE